MFLGKPKLFKGNTKNFKQKIPSGHSWEREKHHHEGLERAFVPAKIVVTR